MVLVFLPLYLTQKLGFDIIITGQIISPYGLGQILGSYYGGVLTDKLGSVKVQIVSFSLTGLLYLLLEFLSIKISIMFSLFFIGLFTASIRPATGNTIAKFCLPTIRTRAYALNYQAINLGNAIGPTLGGVLAAISYMWLFKVEGLANILAAIAIWSFFPKSINTSHQEKASADNGKSSVMKDKSFLIFLLLIFLVGMCLFQLLNIYPLYLTNDYHLSKVEIGMIMAFNGILIMLFQMQLVSYLKNFNPLRIISVGGVLICFGFFILPWHSGFHYALLSMGIITLGEMLTIPFAFDIITKISPTAYQGKYLGLLSCALSSLPLFVTPNLMPYVYKTFGSQTLWSSMGIVGLIIFFGFDLKL